jgi:tetratricopeptide (TPR) repeat protein
MRKGLYREAIGRFRQAYRLNTQLVRVHFYLGTCQHKLENFADALASLQRALESFPEDSKVHYQLALTYDSLRLPQEARRHYQRARAVTENLRRSPEQD